MAAPPSHIISSLVRVSRLFNGDPTPGNGVATRRHRKHRRGSDERGNVEEAGEAYRTVRRQDWDTAAAPVCQTQLMSRSAGRIRTRRLLLGMNQQAFADALDLTFQQVRNTSMTAIG